MENSVSITQRVWAKGNPSLTAGLIPLMITGSPEFGALIDLICLLF